MGKTTEMEMKLLKEAVALRYLLWKYHGHMGPELYGDDGELQCHKCCIDFRRDPPERISECLSVL